MKDNILLTEEKEQVALLTLNRPEVMNALNFSLLYALKDQIEALRIRSDIRVIIITGAGDKAFCAGADLKERATLNPAQVKEFILTIKNLFSSIEYLNKPVIAAINGIALGGGTELALASDIRIAASNASLGLTETRLAIIPGAGGTQRLPRLVGRGKAKELIFTGRRVMAEEALQINLVNHTCESALLIEECQKIGGDDMRNRPPLPLSRPNMLLITVLKPIFRPALPSNRTPIGLPSRPKTGWRPLLLLVKKESPCSKENSLFLH